jgi:hypothetical protein
MEQLDQRSGNALVNATGNPLVVVIGANAPLLVLLLVSTLF